MDDDVLACTMKGSKMECTGTGAAGPVPAMPARVAWMLVIAAIIMVVIAAVINHVIFSTSSPVYTFPFFGGIDIERGTLYDISLFMFVGAVVAVIVAFVFTVKRQTRIVMIR